MREGSGKCKASFTFRIDPSFVLSACASDLITCCAAQHWWHLQVFKDVLLTLSLSLPQLQPPAAVFVLDSQANAKPEDRPMLKGKCKVCCCVLQSNQCAHQAARCAGFSQAGPWQGAPAHTALH